MGCGHSKPKLPRGGVRASAAVALCRDSCALLAEAIARRYALADAHRAYAASPSATGAALHDFLRAVHDAAPLPLPAAGPDDAPHGGDDAVIAPAPIPVAPHAEAADDDDDDGHIHFCSDADEASDDGGGRGISPTTAEQMAASPRPQAPQMAVPYTPQAAAAPYGSGYPPRQVPAPYIFDYPAPYGYSPVPGPAYGYGSGYEADMGGGFGRSSYDVSYTQSHPPPPLVSYHQGQSDAIPSSHSHYEGYPPYQYHSQPLQQAEGWPPVSASSSGQLPPPSSAMESAWGFLYPFEALEGYYQDHPAAPVAQSSNDIRDKDQEMPELEEDEEIPELEDEECTSSTTLSEDKEDQHIEFKESSSDAASNSNGSCTVHGNGVEGDNNAAREELEEHSGVAEAEPPFSVAHEKMYDNDIEVVQEIKLQFEHASKSAGDVCKMLEVGKMPHSEKNSGLKVFSMMICVVPSKHKKFLKFEEEKAMECGNLSSSLQQLYCWEKKLLQEVKCTERMRVIHEQKRKTLKKLYNGGAEAYKLEEVEVSIKKLLSRIDVAVRIVNTISNKINKLRDEELWPQTHELIRGFMQMWDVMSKCHHIQCHAMSQAKNIDSAMAAAKFREAHMHLLKRLEFQLLDMTTSFAAWFRAQKIYAITLNSK
ncbi:hypothetical protein BS78_K039600 [Paspalum vaginatum]|uniref:DUF632 domain-containing protein n=1 Tax=Paspalum vaginatum TaxID=158149 RepID=A0A9W8CEG3_9POAL|nr:hypothetical protein BS78_K039600 [Paspalum vaginatum]